MSLNRWFALTLTASWLVPFALWSKPLPSKGSFDTQIVPFFKKHCYQCHGLDKQKADRRFDNLRYPIIEDDQIIDYQDALDQLNLGEMPPEDQPQPQPEEVSKVVAWLTAAISEAQANRDSSGGETVLRRLNRREYQHDQ